MDRCVEREVENIDGASTRARLHDRNSLDLGVDQGVGVAAHDHVDFAGELARQINDFTTAVGRGRALARRTCVSDDDDEVGTAFSEDGRNAVDDRRGIVEAKSDDVAGARRRRRRDGRNANDADLRSPAGDDGVVRNPAHVATVDVANVGAEDPELRLSHSRAERIDPPIELVVAERRRGVTHSVVVLDHWTPERQVRGGSALEQISGIE